jgi:DNA modification methylase
MGSPQPCQDRAVARAIRAQENTIMQTPSGGERAPMPAATSVDPLLAMHVQPRAIATLSAFGRQARLHSKEQIRRLAEGIRTFGFLVPVLVDDAGKVLAGNGRIEAAKHLGMDTVPTIALHHLDEAAKRAFVIAENRLAELAEWDDEVLRLELEELSGLDLGFSIDLTGFQEVEIEGLIFAQKPTPKKADAIPAPAAKPVSRLGDVWRLGDHRLICGDATDRAVIDALMQGETAQAAFTDPPYNVAIDGHVSTGDSHREFVMASGEMSDAEFEAFLTSTFERLRDGLQSGGVAFVCMDWRHMDHVGRARASAGLELLNLVVWDKTLGGMGSFYRSRHELVFVFRMPGAAHLNRVCLGAHGRDRHNVWTYEGMIGAGRAKARARSLHPTVKPAAMVRDALLDCTAKGDRVLDLFCGSGTILVAAEEIGRRARAVELDPIYVDVAVRRWEAFSGKQACLDANGATFAQIAVTRASELASSAPQFPHELAPPELAPPEMAPPERAPPGLTPSELAPSELAHPEWARPELTAHHGTGSAAEPLSRAPRRIDGRAVGVTAATRRRVRAEAGHG